MNIKKILVLIILLLSSITFAKGGESLLNIQLKPAAKSILFPQFFNAGVYANISSIVNIDYNADNYKTGKSVDQDTRWFMQTGASFGPVIDLDLYKNLNLETKALYRFEHWRVEDNSFNIHSIENRNSFIYNLDFLKIQYRLILWLKLPYTRFEALYQLKNPALDPAIADDKGKYYAYDYKEVSYRSDLINRHLVGIIVPMEKFFTKFDWPKFPGINMLEFFLKFEMYFNYSALDNNEFETEEHGENIYGDMISVSGTKTGFNENVYMRYRIYSGFDIKNLIPLKDLSLSLNYIYESNFYYEQYDAVKQGEYSQSSHTIRLAALYRYDFMQTDNKSVIPQQETDETSKTKKEN